MSAERLLERFTRLCEIASPSRDERSVADAVAAELSAAGIEVAEDDSGERTGSNAGNLVARVAGASERWVSLFSHLDTVPHDGPIEVELHDGVFKSRGDTILGADNKAAVAVLIELGIQAAERGSPVGLELVFTTVEEEGLIGARHFDPSALRAPFGYALDLAEPIGRVVTAAPTYNRVTADFEGVEAHSGIRPEDGRSAIRAAAAAVGRMELGRLDEETTANAGTIQGGTATNIVAGHCRLVCEARSLSDEGAARATQMLVDACTAAATDTGCDVDIDVEEVFRSYRIPRGSAALAIARDALGGTGHQVQEISTGGGSDANALVANGYECVLLANGTEANHTPQESVRASNLAAMLEVCEAIASGVASAPDPDGSGG